MLLSTLTLSLSLVACNGGGDDSASPDDSGATTDDSGTTDTQTEPVYKTVGLEFTAPADTQDGGTVTVGLVRVYDESDTFNVGDTLAAGDAGSTTAEFTLPEAAPTEHLLEDTEHPGLMVATYAGTAWVDATPDSAFTDGSETVLGADSDALLAYLTGEVPEDWPEGWILVDHHFADGDTAGDPSFKPTSQGIDIVGRGLLDVNLTLSGTYTPWGAGARGVVGLALDSDGEPNLDDPVFDVSLTNGPFSIALTSGPGPDFSFPSAEAGANMAIIGMAIYDDGDGSGDYTWFLELDADGHTVCLAGDPVGLLFLGPSTSLGAVIGLDIVEWQAGWSAVTGESEAADDLTRLSDVQATQLVIGAACQVDI